MQMPFVNTPDALFHASHSRRLGEGNVHGNTSSTSSSDPPSTLMLSALGRREVTIVLAVLLVSVVACWLTPCAQGFVLTTGAARGLKRTEGLRVGGLREEEGRRRIRAGKLYMDIRGILKSRMLTKICFWKACILVTQTKSLSIPLTQANLPLAEFLHILIPQGLHRLLHW